MTHRVAGSSRGVPRIWLLPIIILTGLLTLTATDVLSRSLLLDLVAWWPVWLVLALAAMAAHRRRIGRIRLGGLVPLLIAGVLGTFIVAHLNGWSLNPSATRFLVGPEADSYEKAELTASIDGEIVIRGGSAFLYEVDPLHRGGAVGIPSAEESTVGESIAVLLMAPDDPGFDGFAGWDIALSSGPRWALDLGGRLRADLRGISIASLDVSGWGMLRLGAVTTLTPVDIEGAVSIEVPRAVATRVIGTAHVPAKWEETLEGWRSPVGGNGWVIVVSEGSVVSIRER